MTQSEQKAAAIKFIENFNHADEKVFAGLITEDFKFEIVSGLAAFPPIHGRQNFAPTEAPRSIGRTGNVHGAATVSVPASSKK